MSRVVHFEIPSDNPEKSIAFYKKVFGWTFTQFGPTPYFLATTGPDNQPGINGAIMKKNHPQQPFTNSINVDDIDQAMREVENAGGKIVVPKTTMPGVGYSAYFMDLDNNIFGLWKEDRNAKIAQ
ncbi:MAG TPA: VOC family protein [Cyclobacteriaceae bacterium]|nr:VOC family protein [Cyclobacteriaceae bacterium]